MPIHNLWSATATFSTICLITTTSVAQTTVALWGNLASRLGRDPFPLVLDARAAAVGEAHVVVLREDGSLMVRDFVDSGLAGDVLTVPLGLRATKVASGYRHIAALSNDRRVICWGLNNYGQCNLAAIVDAVDVTCGQMNTFVLLENGETRHAGSGTPPLFTSVTKICAMGDTFGIIRTNGRAYTTSRENPPPNGLTLREMDAGESGGIGIRPTGELVLWGRIVNSSTTSALPVAVEYSDGSAHAPWAMVLGSDGRIESIGSTPTGAQISPLDRGVASQIMTHSNGPSESSVGVFGPTALVGSDCPTDIDGNGEVDFGDVALVLLEFGPCR